jgi:predicted ester cyclase
MDDPRTVAARWQDAYGSHDEQEFRDVLAPDARLVGPTGVFEGEPAITRYMMAWAHAFPDSRYTSEHVTVDGDTVVMESTFTGTHLGTLVDAAGDIPASSRHVEARSAHAVVVEGDRVREVRMYFDVLGFLAQLGVLPVGATTS